MHSSWIDFHLLARLQTSNRPLSPSLGPRSGDPRTSLTHTWVRVPRTQVRVLPSHTLNANRTQYWPTQAGMPTCVCVVGPPPVHVSHPSCACGQGLVSCDMITCGTRMPPPPLSVMLCAGDSVCGSAAYTSSPAPPSSSTPTGCPLGGVVPSIRPARQPTSSSHP